MAPVSGTRTRIASVRGSTNSLRVAPGGDGAQRRCRVIFEPAREGAMRFARFGVRGSFSPSPNVALEAFESSDFGRRARQAFVEFGQVRRLRCQAGKFAAQPGERIARDA